MVYPSNPQAYEIEFVGDDGWMVALLTLQEEDVTMA